MTEPTYKIRKIPVKTHTRTYHVGDGKGGYKTVVKTIKKHDRKIPQLNFIPQAKDIKRRYVGKTMVKKIPDNLIEGIKTLAKDQDHEYSIDIDFERELESPEQMLVMKGGRKSTIKIGDFELFGHTHPNETYPYPSNTDLRILFPMKPEFIVAQKTGKTIIMNIEDYDKWKEWKESGKDVRTNLVDVKWGREKLLNETGVKVYPMVKNLKIELADDPHREKQFPRASKEKTIEWHKKLK